MNPYEIRNMSMLDMEYKECIDAVITDPPYHLTSITERFGKSNSKEAQFGKDGSFKRLSKGFMGKEWDGGDIAFRPETWRKCYDALKPGGYLLAFGGTRTFHRIACAIEDAGFEIRDTIMWLYGCLSNDTEILTSNGWKNSATIKQDDEIYSLDLQKNIIIKNKVKNIFKYDYDGEMVNLKNSNTNQLLTPNHHCIVNDKLKTRIKGETNYNSHDYWYYKDAWQIRSETTKLPLASNYDGKLEIGNLFAELLGWVISEGTYIKDTNAIMITQSSVNKKYVERIRYILGKLHIKYSEYSRERTYKDRKYIEYDFYIGKEEEKIVNKIKEIVPDKKLNWGLLELSLSNKKFLIKGLLQGDGAKDNNTIGFSSFYQKDIEQLKIFQVLLHLSNKQGWLNEKKYSCSIHNNPTTEIQGKHFKNRLIKYTGKYVWCIETEIGNFIAKRDEKIFITGNSGFPKSHNIGLAIDKKMGCPDRGHRIATASRFHPDGTFEPNGETIPPYEAKTNEGSKWQNWGTALKPAFEPIIVARKPFRTSVAENIMKYGVGGINIDECRVGKEHFEIKDGSYDNNKNQACFGNIKRTPKSYEGRFPANILTDGSEEVVELFPSEAGGGRESGYNFEKTNQDNVTNILTNIKSGVHFGDSGSASRFFYAAKASKKDRDEGCDYLEDGLLRRMRPDKDDNNPTGLNKEGRFAPVVRKNIHPTVKPCELMQYLVRLVSPKGATILDPFMGSGSTGKAVMFENRERNAGYKFIGIDLEKEYCEIAEARIDYALNKYEYDAEEEKQLAEAKGQLSLF